MHGPQARTSAWATRRGRAHAGRGGAVDYDLQIVHTGMRPSKTAHKLNRIRETQNTCKNAQIHFAHGKPCGCVNHTWIVRRPDQGGRPAGVTPLSYAGTRHARVPLAGARSTRPRTWANRFRTRGRKKPPKGTPPNLLPPPDANRQFHNHGV